MTALPAKPADRHRRHACIALAATALPLTSPARKPAIDRTPMNTTARGRFEVQLVPLPNDAVPEATKLGRMSIDKRISGDLMATTRGQMLTAMTDTKGSAGYVAIERVDGTLHGRRGSFVLQHSGTMERGAQSLAITVVPDSGTGELAGLRGTFRIQIVDGRHDYEFEYTLP